MESKSVEIHKELNGKIVVDPKKEITGQEGLSTFYTPGVAKACEYIRDNKGSEMDITIRGNTVAIVTDGTRVLGLGDIGPEAALPVMEGKAMLMKQFGGVNAFPLCIKERDKKEIIKFVENISPTFGAINLEDIETPKVFDIHEELSETLDIPVFHDDQHGTGIVVLSAMINAMKVAEKGKDAKIAVVGTGSAGYGIVKMLHYYGFENITAFDSKGAISEDRKTELPKHKKHILEMTNPEGFSGKIDKFYGADAVISASRRGSVPLDTLRKMNDKKIVFALSNPVPEISPNEAMDLGVEIYGTGRSDLPNQINNAVCFPYFFHALLKMRAKRITKEMYIKTAEAIASVVENPDKNRIIPSVFNKNILPKVVDALCG